jgi:hypothetical protein
LIFLLDSGTNSSSVTIFLKLVMINDFGTIQRSYDPDPQETSYHKPDDIKLTVQTTITATRSGPIALPVFPVGKWPILVSRQNLKGNSRSLWVKNR